MIKIITNRDLTIDIWLILLMITMNIGFILVSGVGNNIQVVVKSKRVEVSTGARVGNIKNILTSTLLDEVKNINNNINSAFANDIISLMIGNMKKDTIPKKNTIKVFLNL